MKSSNTLISTKQLFLRYLSYLRNVFFILTPLLSFSQQYNFRNYSVSEGLAQSQVYAQCEDKNGSIWFGTRGGGISRFDGINFTNYTVHDGLPSNYIRTITKDKSGNLWIGTDKGLSKYDGKKFHTYSSPQGLYNDVVNTLLQDKKGNLWIGTDNGIFLLEKDTIVRFGRKLGAPMERINSLAQDTKGNILAGTEHGLFQFNTNDVQKLTTQNGLPNNIITFLTNGINDDIWIGTYGGGVAKINGNSIITIITKAEGLASNTVFCCTIETNGNVWFGTANGISKWNPNDSTIHTITETEGLSNNVVMSIIKDSFGNLWFGTSGGGVSKLDSERFIHYTAIKGSFGNWVYSITQDKEGDMWFATSEGGVTKYDGTYYKRYSEKDGFTASKVKYLHEDINGNLWLGTISDGLYLYDGKSFRHFNNKNGLKSNFINYILSDTSGRIFIATAGGGIDYLLPSTNGTFKIKHINQKNGLRSDRVNTLIFDSEDKLWAGCLNGYLSKITFKEDEIASIANYKTAGNNIRCSVKDKQGNLFFGTADAGIILYDNKRFYIYSQKQNLSSNNIYSLLFDTQSNLWIGTERGIDKLSLLSPYKIRQIQHYGKSEGFIGIETIQNSSYLDKSGNLWFGSIKSATVFNPLNEHQLSKPNTLITGITLFFDKIETTPFGKNTQGWYPLPKQLSLPYDQNHLSFDFIGIEQSNPEAVRYKWKLDGFDKDWSPISSKREAVYSNLPPGEYDFKVIACNELGQWNTKATTYQFTISPPFWKTWWFRLSALILLILCLWFLITYAFKKIKEENEVEKQKLETEKTLIELEQKALRLQMNPHFLFNCLNSIKGLIAENKPEEAKIYLSKFAKLMRSMLDNSREQYVSLENEISGLNRYVELEKLSGENTFDFLIDIDKNIDPDFITIPPMLIQPFVENAIIHGIMPLKTKGKIQLQFMLQDAFIKCTVLDNGIGREKANQLKQDSIQGHKSTAIAITQERLNILNNKLGSEKVQIIITDIINKEQEAEGTKVELLIPYQQHD